MLSVTSTRGVSDHMSFTEAQFMPSSLLKACFSPESVAYQLEHHVGALRVLCEELTSPESQQELKRALGDYEQKIERLLKCASEVHMTLLSSQAGTLKERLVPCKRSHATEQS